ncbi:hypothetical protein C0W40_21320 [Photobacterium leiognathi subsp. mandapamensis]|nr:hypothetical protein C0W40_21320 [Photobacterium leiognathi subsp. mandapamensis]
MIKKQSKLESEHKIIEEKTSDINLSTWVSILLGCVAVIITVLGVIVAILSIYGYKNLKDSTLKASIAIAETTTSDIAKEEVKKCIDSIAKNELIHLIDSGQLTSHLENAVDVIIRREKILSDEAYHTLNISEEENNLDELDKASMAEHEA